jgi:hypothetical protein
LKACIIVEERPAFVQELARLTIFESAVFQVEHDRGADHDVK